jgi:lipopolysaccharide/colanic/teichoic acid biosynthesis glycosyltransferase
MDHRYAERPSLRADLAILARTVLVVLGATGR